MSFNFLNVAKGMSVNVSFLLYFFCFKEQKMTNLLWIIFLFAQNQRLFVLFCCLLLFFKFGTKINVTSMLVR